MAVLSAAHLLSFAVEQKMCLQQLLRWRFVCWTLQIAFWAATGQIDVED